MLMENPIPFFPHLPFNWPFLRLRQPPFERFRFLLRMTGHAVGHFDENLSCPLSASSLQCCVCCFPPESQTEFYLLKQDAKLFSLLLPSLFRLRFCAVNGIISGFYYHC